MTLKTLLQLRPETRVGLFDPAGGLVDWVDKAQLLRHLGREVAQAPAYVANGIIQVRHPRLGSLPFCRLTREL